MQAELPRFSLEGMVGGNTLEEEKARKNFDRDYPMTNLQDRPYDKH